MFKKLFGAIAVAALVLTTAACAPAPKPVASNGLPSVYSQKLATKKCGEFLCGTVNAPIDWANPEGDTFKLAFSFKQVEGSGKYLFVNPGGPGASGIELATTNLDSVGTDKLRSTYNIVGFDPRGTKGSSPVKCFDAKKMDDFLYGDTGFMVGTPEDLAASRKAVAEFTAACKKNTGEILGHLDTVSAAKDLDLLRAVFSQSKLNYLGFSYGTFLGTTYAALFPQNVGRFVLDGAIDPTVSDEDQNYNQLKGFDLALHNYMKDCIDNQADCPFSGSVELGLSRISQFLSAVEKKPLPTSDGRMAGLAATSTGMYLTLYSNDYWKYLTQAFNEAFDSKEGSVFMQLADFYNNRNADGTYADNMFEAFISINCLDGRSDASPAAQAKQNNRMLAASPTLGRYWQNGAEMCAHWPYPLAERPASYAADGAPSIVVIGTTGDPATPYQQAVDLAHKVLADGLLVTYKGEGHTAYGRSNACISRVVDSFLVAGVVPVSEPTC
ncbi:MAG: alpha/beta hydrolase [Rhodoluna sp.]|nr:alpha/beta hydrolase [Rhodoluna sp.]